MKIAIRYMFTLLYSRCSMNIPGDKILEDEVGQKRHRVVVAQEP